VSEILAIIFRLRCYQFSEVAMFFAGLVKDKFFDGLVREQLPINKNATEIFDGI
jgi:hypothetical protein